MVLLACPGEERRPEGLEDWRRKGGMRVHSCSDLSCAVVLGTAALSVLPLSKTSGRLLLLSLLLVAESALMVRVVLTMLAALLRLPLLLLVLAESGVAFVEMHSRWGAGEAGDGRLVAIEVEGVFCCGPKRRRRKSALRVSAHLESVRRMIRRLLVGSGEVALGTALVAWANGEFQNGCDVVEGCRECLVMVTVEAGVDVSGAGHDTAAADAVVVVVPV